jgi:hypothetical protein
VQGLDRIVDRLGGPFAGQRFTRPPTVCSPASPSGAAPDSAAAARDVVSVRASAIGDLGDPQDLGHL